ncbi:MAG: NAD(P)-dependent alcohol dehydrogenase [Bifidobacteriaceae bacterium]|jgi:propanol-preferring alcohol dehydrogenase|nr:NAD(P)-dependent alcohol dehydrogenase [Bifidobacteriaceae bacterium]
MKAIQLIRPGEWPELREVPIPRPGPGQILLRITAAGLCHIDVTVVERVAAERNYRLPQTLGHECAGRVVDAGDGVKHLVNMSEDVLVYGPWGCGRCRQCAEGYENYCYNARARGIFPPGLGRDGGAAEYMLVDRARYLVPIKDLDPVQAVPLTDAALTPYHALQHSRAKLDANSYAVVFGVGGLGHVAIQLIKHLTPARVIALDVSERHLALAKEMGADYAFRSNADAVEIVQDLTHGQGAEVVFDFAGVQASIDLGAKMTKVRGDWNIVGIGGGKATVGFGVVPYECNVFSPYWGTRGELYDVVALARRGVIKLHVEEHPLEDGEATFQRLYAGQVMGRAVLTP